MYYQSGDMGFEKINDNSYFNDKSYALNWLKGDSGTVYTHLYEDGCIKQANRDGAFGSWDTPFTIEWFNYIKTHPEDDGFYIFAQINDETWFENKCNTYSYSSSGRTYRNLSGLCIANACLAGTQNETYYGSYVDGITSGWKANISYKSYYNASALGENVWFQLLTQTIDNLGEKYNINLDRQYIMGASLGGIATIDLVSHNPNRFAAAFPCSTPCADISEENVSRIVSGGTVIRAYHGSNDGLVSPIPCKTLCENIANNGGNATFTLDSGGHESMYLKNHFDNIMNVIHNTSK